MNSKPSILASHQIDDFDFQLTSDNHMLYETGNEQAAAERLASLIIEAKRSETLFLLGDHFEAEDAEENVRSTSLATNILMDELSGSFENILYTAGNHCLRREERTSNPWADFDFPSNVISPKGSTPEIVDIKGKKILLGNIFYDLEFIEDYSLVNVTREGLMEFFANTTDGQSLLEGADSVPFYAEMISNMANKLTPDVDLIASHCLPHPSLVNFRVDEITPEIEAFIKETGVPFMADAKGIEDDPRYIADPEKFKRYWNYKSFVMGSNVFAPKLGADPKEGLNILHGHNHRNQKGVEAINGKKLNYITHQPRKVYQLED